jgi:hypothetical protein
VASCADDANRLDDQRCLPGDHPSHPEEPVLSGESVAWAFLYIIRKSGVVPYLNQR